MRFVGRRLGLARALGGVTQRELGEKVAATPGQISHIEKGSRQPSPDLLEALGEVLGFESEWFYMPILEEFQETECSFRKRASTPQKLKDQALAHGTLVGELIRYLRDRLSLPAFNVPAVPVRDLAAAEAAAERCRLYWGLGLDAPIMTLGRVLENAGIVLSQIDVQSTKVDAFCRWGDLSVVMLNTSKGSASRTLFDIAHEAGHLVMHRGLEPGAPEREAEADRFAAAFLLPRSGFARDFLSYRRVDWPHLFELKKRWRASVAAILHRAFELRLMDAVSYRRMVKQLYARGWHKGEPHEPTQEVPELLALAVDSMQSTYGRTPYDIAADLGWRPETFKHIAHVPLGDPPATESQHVISLRRFRDRKTTGRNAPGGGAGENSGHQSHLRLFGES